MRTNYGKILVFNLLKATIGRSTVYLFYATHRRVHILDYLFIVTCWPFSSFQLVEKK